MRIQLGKMRRKARSGLTLVELLVCIVIIAIALVETRITIVNSLTSFNSARDNLSGTWMASTLMNELMASELPNFDGAGDGEPRGYISGGGDFASFLQESYPDVANNMSDDRLFELSEWTYSWTKEVVLINERGEKRTDQSGQPPDYALDGEDLTDEEVADLREDDPNYEDPRELAALPTAQVIRIRLVLSPPGAAESAPEDSNTGVYGSSEESNLYDPQIRAEVPQYDEDTQRDRSIQRRKHIVLIRYIDIENLRASLVPAAENAPEANR